MKRITTFLLLLLISSASIKLNAQNHEWTISTGSTATEEGTNVCTDNFGNVYTSGSFIGTLDFDPGPGVVSLTSVGSGDKFVAKYTSAGALVWVKQFNGTLFLLNEIMANFSGEVFITGAFSGTFDSDPNAGTVNLVSNGNRDVFVIRLSSAGNLVWSKSFGGTGHDIGNAITIDNLSNVIIGGYFNSTVDFDPGVGTFNLISSFNGDAFLVKLDANGNFSWADNISRANATGSYSGISSLDTDDAMNIYYTGYFSGNIDLNPDNGIDQLHTSTSGFNDVFIGKVDAGGNYSWGKVIGSTGSDYTACLRNDFVNHIYLTGNFTGTLDCDPSASVSNITSLGSVDAFALILDISGNFVFAKNMGGTVDDYGYAVEATYDGFLVTGTYQNSFSFFGGGSSQTVLGGGGGPNDIFLEKMDFNGNHLWTRTWAGTGAESSKKVAFSPDEKIYLTGSYQFSVDFDPGIYSNLQTANGTFSDYFLLKLQCPSNSIVSENFCYDYVSPSGNYVWTTNGTYQDTIPNAFGCDSVMSITINSVNNTGTANVQGCGQYVSPSGNYTWNTPGTYMDTIPNMNGCDSVLTLNLTIVTVDTTVTTQWSSLQVPLIGGATYQWYNCVLGNQLVGETSNYLNPTLNGLYYVEITFNGCTFMSGCHSYNTVGIEESNSTEVKLYPNPANDFLQIESDAEMIHITVFDIAGRAVLSQETGHKSFQLQLDGLSTGKYTLRVITEKGVFTDSFIKN